MGETRLYIDIETYSSVDLKKCGVYKYAESPDFDILLFGYAFDDDPAEVMDLTIDTGLTRQAAIALNALMDPSILKLAYNAAFERVCISAWLIKRSGRKHLLRADGWECLAVKAAELGLPRSLEEVGAAMGLPEGMQKLKTGKSLINYFCTPHKPKGIMDGQTQLFEDGGRGIRRLPSDDRERWQEFIEYNRMDVEAEREVHKRLSGYDITGGSRLGPVSYERQAWLMDQEINDRGVAVDINLAEKAVSVSMIIKDRLTEEAKSLTGIKNPKSAEQVKTWIKQKTGLQVDTLKKGALSVLKNSIDDRDVSAMMELRAQLAKSSLEKYSAILRTVCRDGRIRGLTQFYGANRTGRWAGRLVQLQNLPAGKLNDLGAARELLSKGDLGSLELLFGDVPDVLSQLLRTAFIPGPGKVFAVADFNAIEARVLAWLADEKWRLDVFNSHGKIYEASAERMFNLPPGSVKRGDPIRQKGKIAELALGYGGGTGALVTMGALSMGLEENELQPLVDHWRDANRNITRFWRTINRMAVNLIKGPLHAEMGPLTYISFYKDGPLMRVKLPSGRYISYVRPSIKDGRIYFEGVTQGTKQWGKIETYGAKLVENIVQAVARDCLAEAMLKIEAEGIPIVFHVHDEVICEVDTKRADRALKRVTEIMSAPPDWAPGLPMGAEGFICGYYQKG